MKIWINILISDIRIAIKADDTFTDNVYIMYLYFTPFQHLGKKDHADDFTTSSSSSLQLNYPQSFAALLSLSHDQHPSECLTVVSVDNDTSSQQSSIHETPSCS